ncbi:cell division protein ZapA [Haloimpatiens sp. FM7330]|uniref:cell division protein ZapA n=1 Tax=Haloimpatiens sp. FM7330 TaxID=3298610 RepID=UPI0036427A1A
MNVITININGFEYNLKGEECEEYLHKVAGYVDKKMKNLMDNNKKLSVCDSAILTALNIADDMFKFYMKQDELLAKVKEYDKNESHLKEQVDYLKKQIKNLEQYNEELKNKLDSNGTQEEIKNKDQIIENLKDQVTLLEESANSYLEDRNKLKRENKELRFEVKSSKYRIIDLENKLMENQIDLAKAKKNLNIPVKKVK